MMRKTDDFSDYPKTVPWFEAADCRNDLLTYVVEEDKP